MPESVNTAKVTDRRKLQFNSIDDLLRDVDRVAAAERAGRLRRTGNWSAGQVMGHLAAWADFGYDGYPFKAPPWPIRQILKWKVKSFLKNGMDCGVRIPGPAAGTYAVENLPIEEGADRIRKAFGRLKSGAPAKFHSPAFGEMSHADRVKLNLRHAELHLSFLHP